MHGAFDVGMQNKRLSLFAIKVAAVEVFEPVKPEKPDRPLRLAKSVKPANPERVETPVRARDVAWICTILFYIALVLSDYLGAPRIHGSKLAVLVLVCTPTLNLILHVTGAPTPTLAAVTAAHLAVALEFMWDARRFHRDTVSLVTLWAVAAVFIFHAAGSRPADMTWRCHVMCSAIYVGTCLTLGTAVLDSMTLLTLHQLFLVVTLLLASLVHSPAHC